MKRVMFVNVVDRLDPVQTRYYPLAFGYLVSYCYEYEEAFEYKYVETVNGSVLKNLRPDIVALTTTTENYNLAKQYAYIIKRFNSKIKVVIGGVHISAVPNSLSRNMDIGVIGEGEATFLELLRNDFEPNPRIKGIAYWQNDVVYQTEARKLIEPLDLIPHPTREMYPLNRDQYLFASRGCPYRCVFCFSSRFWKKLRFHSPGYVATEIQQIKQNFNISFLYIFDDTFILDVERVKQIKELVKPLGLTYSVSARANLVTKEVVKLLKEMGVVTVGIGFESNSPKILKYLQKGNTVKDNQRAVDILRKYKIRVFGSFIRDIPVETKEDLKATYNFIHRNKLPYVMYRLMRYPGTPIYDGSEDWDSYKIYYYESRIKKMRRCLSKIKPLKLMYNYLKIHGNRG